MIAQDICDKLKPKGKDGSEVQEVIVPEYVGTLEPTDTFSEKV